jgi:glycosyltransferase involved in cell wall biosynthesis
VIKREILILIPCLLKGGTEIQTLHLIKVLVDAGYQVNTLCYFESDEIMVTKFKKVGSDVILLKWERNISAFSFILKLRKEISNLTPDIVHVQYMAPGALPIIAAKLAGVPRIIATVHQPYTSGHGKFSKYILRIASLFCKPFLSVSQNAEHSWFGSSQLIQMDLPIAKQAKHLTLYNTVDVEKLQGILKENADKLDLKALGIPEDALVMGTVSRLRHEKGIDILIKAFASVQQTASLSLRLLVVGDGPDMLGLEILCKELSCLDKVIFFGAADWDQAMRLMAQMDLVIVPSRFEGFGLTAAEAMGMGKALIASNTFGLKELISHRKEGLLFENGSVEDLKSQMDFMINHVDQRSIFGQNGYIKTRNQFDFPIFIRNVKTLYQLS